VWWEFVIDGRGVAARQARVGRLVDAVAGQRAELALASRRARMAAILTKHDVNDLQVKEALHS
jgi:hypothetical protein